LGAGKSAKRGCVDNLDLPDRAQYRAALDESHGKGKGSTVWFAHAARPGEAKGTFAGPQLTAGLSGHSP